MRHIPNDNTILENFICENLVFLKYSAFLQPNACHFLKLHKG